MNQREHFSTPYLGGKPIRLQNKVTTSQFAHMSREFIEKGDAVIEKFLHSDATHAMLTMSGTQEDNGHAWTVSYPMFKAIINIKDAENRYQQYEIVTISGWPNLHGRWLSRFQQEYGTIGGSIVPNEVLGFSYDRDNNYIPLGYHQEPASAPEQTV